MKKIFITRNLPSIASTILQKYFVVHINKNNRPLPHPHLTEIVRDYNGILSTVSDKFTKEVLKKSNKLEVISNYAAGLDNIDVAFAKYKNISVYNTPDVVTNSTADLTFALLLSLIRKITFANEFVRQDKWKFWDPDLFLGEELYDKVIGILGFGKIGQAVAKRALGFGLNVIYYDPFVNKISPTLEPHVKQVSFDELLKQSNYISIHVSLTTETKRIINTNTIAKMKKQPVLLNLARGEIIDTDDLVNALKKGMIKGAALDVTLPEPVPGNHPLCNIENCLIVPHIGTATHECRYAMAKASAINIVKHFFGSNER